MNRKGNEYILYDDYAEIVINSAKNGEFKAIIDLEDVEKCKKYTWRIGCYKNRIRLETSITKNNKNVHLRLHRYIINISESKQIVDHINGNTLDNRKRNLRITDKKGNGMNKGLNSNNSSGIKGVYWCNSREKWVASIKVNGKREFLGYFNDKEEARVHRREAEIEYFKEYSRDYGRKYKIRECFKEELNNTSKKKIEEMIKQMIFVRSIEVW